MNAEHHDLVHEFPELRQRIHELKISDQHFRKLFDEYHQLTNIIENMEKDTIPVTTATEQAAKLRRVQLKDQLYQRISA